MLMQSSICQLLLLLLTSTAIGSSETKCDGTPKNCDAVNLDLKGGDLTSHLGNSNEHCSCKCKENAACKAWTFVNYGNNKGACWLKKEVTLVMPTYRESTNFTSGYLECKDHFRKNICTSPVTDTRCNIDGVGFHANNTLEFFRVNSEEKCSCECMQNPKCHSWSYAKGYCWLKEKSTKKVINRGVISGFKKCVVKPKICTDKSCLEEGISYEFNTIAEFNSISLTKEECSCKCLNNAKCKAWTFVKGEKKDGINWCYLKSKANNRKSKSNSTSGRTSCSCGGHQKCFDPDTDYIANGADIGWIRVNSEKDCSCECDKDDRCRIWTWVKGRYSKCYIKTSKALKGRRPNVKSVISGRKSCICTDTNCIEEDVGYLSNNVGVLSGLGLTKEECSCQCQDNDKCVAWTFAKDQNGDGVNHCFLKATTDGRQPTRNLVSGRKTCSGCKASKSCQDPGVDYYYGDIRTVLGSATPDECACQCEKVNECGSWTWAKGSPNRCMLKRKEAAKNRYSCSTCVSGLKRCMCDTQNCIEENTGYFSLDLAVHKDFDLTKEECSCLCKDNKDCKGWTFAKDEEGDGVNQCHLKKSLAKKKAMANMTSGEKDCPCRANKACQQPKADYWYGDIKTVKAISPEECACQCERLNKCQVWTWVKGAPGRCLLKNGKAKANKRHCSTCISGFKKC